MLLLGASGSFSKKQFCGGKNLIKKKNVKVDQSGGTHKKQM